MPVNGYKRLLDRACRKCIINNDKENFFFLYYFKQDIHTHTIKKYIVRIDFLLNDSQYSNWSPDCFFYAMSSKWCTFNPAEGSMCSNLLIQLALFQVGLNSPSKLGITSTKISMMQREYHLWYHCKIVFFNTKISTAQNTDAFHTVLNTCINHLRTAQHKFYVLSILQAHCSSSCELSTVSCTGILQPRNYL